VNRNALRSPTEVYKGLVKTERQPASQVGKQLECPVCKALLRFIWKVRVFPKMIHRLLCSDYEKNTEVFINSHHWIPSLLKEIN
jgi:hypothetical protein